MQKYASKYIGLFAYSLALQKCNTLEQLLIQLNWMSAAHKLVISANQGNKALLFPRQKKLKAQAIHPPNDLGFPELNV